MWCLNVLTALELLCVRGRGQSSPLISTNLQLLIKMKFHPLSRNLFKLTFHPRPPLTNNFSIFSILTRMFSHRCQQLVALLNQKDFLSPLFGAGSASSLNTGKSPKYQSSSPYIVMLAVITSMLVFSYHLKLDTIFRTTTTTSSS